MNDTKDRINKMLKKSEVILNAGKPKPQTNFEWLTETPERLANWIENILIESGCEVTQCSEMWIGWLKQPHG